MSEDKNILSIDFDDDNENYKAFSEYLEEDTKRKKNRASREIVEMGDVFLKEIDRKKKLQKEKISKLIPYIIKHCEGKYDEDELNTYSYDDVLTIYNEIVVQKRPVIIKIFRFLFNI